MLSSRFCWGVDFLKLIKKYMTGNNASLPRELEVLHNASASLFDFIEEDANDLPPEDPPRTLTPQTFFLFFIAPKPRVE